ncbi:hypothetical protein [Legionella sp. 16cNR16C]|uniref:hypothetical protein n=1 Tax=Legionella sp. 16cNR16C TaxID=2905656 RepID=UPI001E35F527|nr:hypothetical protein [Legionella sp. 16cNR16C]MCE3046309.1 hypothetical protein [Legionella sp. 16cNR16C]
MDILFNEPTSARWFFVNPVTNIIHLLVPAVGGERAGTDNTCQTMMAMKTFFGKNAGEHAGALQEMELYRRALQQDIASISPQDQERRSIREQKQSRLQQIEKIIAALRLIQNTPEISQLNHVYPDYPPSVARLMEGSNVYSMLMPPVTDGYLYTKNRVFTVDRTRNDRFYGAMMLGFNNLVFGSQSPKEQVIRAAVRQLETFRTQHGRDPGFPQIQAILTSVMKEKTGLDVDFSSSPTGAPITPEMLTNIHLEDNPSFRDTVEAWLDSCALELWSTLPISPFQSVNNPNLTAGKKKETLAIMLQFLLAEVNIYARSKDLSQRNFGQVLDENSTLRNSLITSVTGTLAQGGSIEQAVLEFINHNRQAFGLNRVLNTAEQKEIVDYFRSDWATIKDSPHFDEFTIWVDKPGKFVVHQGAICVDFAEVINSGFRNTVSQADLAYFDQARADYQSVNGKLNHTNPSTLASYTIDETRLPGYLLELIANTDNHEALSAILLARTAVRNEGQLQPGPKVFETLSAETVQALKRSPNWARLQNMIGSHITDPVTQTAFNAKFLGALQQINISNEQARALYTAVVKSSGPRAVTGYATTTELRQILTTLGIGDQINIGFNIQNGFSVTVRGEAYDNLVSMLNNYSDKIYITPEMARNFYLQVKERFGENSSQYREMQALNNEGLLPAKMIKALSLLDIHLVRNEHDEPEIDFPAGGVDGYILQIANPQRNLQLIENIQQQQTIFHLTPDLAGLLYQMVNSLGRGNEIASLTNNPSPDKIRQTLDILEISHGLIGFHGNNGYDIHLSPLARERLRMLERSNPTLTGGGGRGSRGRGQAYRAATIPLPMTPVTNAPVAQPPVNPPAARTEPVLPPAAAPAPVNQISIEPVASFHATNLPANASRMDLNCPEPVLQAFRNLLRGEPILGCSFNNPYTHQVETLPSNADELTARHLQILARNERSNVTGIMNTGLYQGKLSDNKIARLRCLVKATNGAGIVQVNAYGGYPHGNPIHTYPSPRRMIVVDQAGLQWQSDFRNTGGMFFYPDNPADAHLPNGFANWQAESFRDMYGYQRPAAPENYRQISWYGVSGKLDLNLVANAISAEFLQAWHAVVAQGDELNQGELVCLKFLKAGMGFFAHGVPAADKPYLEHARLQGILQALQTLAALPENQRAAAIGRIGRLELPFSGNVQGGAANPPGYRDTLEQIGRVVTQLGLQWGGTPTDDVFVERQGFINACTNCGDPHAMIGNEGGHASVDAAMASNANLDGLNAAYNPHLRLRPLPQGLALSHEISPETARALYTAVVNQNGPQAVTGYSSQQELERILTFLRFPEVHSIDSLEGNRFRVNFRAPAIGRLQNILQNYQNSMYVKPETAVSLYLAVKDRFGEGSDEYRTMQSLNNQGGNPAKIQKALELLGITVDRIRFPAGGGNGYIFEASAENRQRLEAIPQQAPAPTAAIPATTTTTTTTTTAATPATVTPATTASVANQPTFFQSAPSSRPSATTDQVLSSNVVESLKVFMKQGARHMPRGSWAEIGTVNGSPFEIGINRGGKYSLASSDYELSILENGDLELLSKNRRNANGRWQTVSGPEKIQVLNQFFRALPLNQLGQHFLLDSLQKLSALTSRSNFQRMSLRDACDRANIFYHQDMPENARLDISPRTRQPCIDIGNERIELEQSRLDFAVRSLNTTAITPSRTQQAIGQFTDNLMVLRVAISTIPPEEDTPATRIGNP